MTTLTVSGTGFAHRNLVIHVHDLPNDDLLREIVPGISPCRLGERLADIAARHFAKSFDERTRTREIAAKACRSGDEAKMLRVVTDDRQTCRQGLDENDAEGLDQRYQDEDVGRSIELRHARSRQIDEKSHPIAKQFPTQGDKVVGFRLPTTGNHEHDRAGGLDRRKSGKFADEVVDSLVDLADGGTAEDDQGIAWQL